MLKIVGGLVLGVVLGLYVGLAFPHQLQDGLAKVGLSSILPTETTSKT